MYKMREISRGKYDDRGYSNEESLAYLQLVKPVEINAFLTYNYGMDDDRFPLTFMTEGQGRNGAVEVDTVQWTWPVMGRMKFTDMVTHCQIVSGATGVGGQEFEIHFATHWFIEQYTCTAPDGQTVCRIQKDLGESPYGYGYLFKLTSPNPTAFVADENLQEGKYWALGAPIVSESYSKGNRSNSMGPGKMTSQLEFYRYSKEIAGNLANQICQYEFKNAQGGTSRLWINEEMRQFNIHMRVMNEERLWLSEYNRNANGEIALKDRDKAIAWAKKLQQMTKKEIIVLGGNVSYKKNYGKNVKIKQGLSPRLFLGYFLKASIIVNASFHGTVFSTLFKKEFYSLDVDNSGRYKQYLNEVGLSDRFVEFDTAPSLLPVNYSGFDDKKMVIVKKSKEYLSNLNI